MLIKFDSKVGTLTMFGEPALQLIRMMGHSGTVPSAILAEDIPAALERLQRALETHVEPPPTAKSADDEEDKNWVPLRRRAFPLVQLLQEATRAKAAVMWEQARSFS
ncbi:MAG TPA: DUF1840 domain-containing protein [Burkholderiales bacterium]|nr:DUF1840 domain-containing protein [Burkholderiales bacterium]